MARAGASATPANNSRAGAADAGRRADTPGGASKRAFIPTILLCFFLGVLGIHRFYVGKIGTGVLQLVTLCGLGIWTLVDFIWIVVGKFRDGNGLLITR
jgi:TM2 domain-containing membrane protein YozV